MGSFRFGVDSIDRLISPDDGLYGSFSADKNGKRNKACEPFVGCIVGPDGTGKSILALHAAATYRADSVHTEINPTSGKRIPDRSKQPSTVYFSTDLSHSQAVTIWEGFGLDLPLQRARLLHDANIDAKESTKASRVLAELHSESVDETRLLLRRLSPFETNDPNAFSSIEVVCDDKTFADGVAFVDLAAETAGDDWTLINRILGATANRKNTVGRPNLIIIDAIEGLEALVGETDAFGLARSRRSRLAQMIRLAKQANTSLLLVIEETKELERLSEVFVSDLVLRLRATKTYGYLQRSLEIEKARGVGHVRGEHSFVIRSGKGTDTLTTSNWDDPALVIRRTLSSTVSKNARRAKGNPLAYLLVLPTLHIREPNTAHGQRGRLGGPLFGIEPIDNLLLTQTNSAPALNDRLFAIVGESGTHKTHLVQQYCRHSISPGDGASAALILSSEQISRESWDAFVLTVAASAKTNVSSVKKRLRIRHLPINHMTSSQFLQILLANIQKLKSAAGVSQPWRLRVVIDNWAVLMESHPTLRDDEMLLRKTIWHLHDQGVTALFVSRQAGSPPLHGVKRLPHDISQLDIRKICVWPVYFFGGQKVAITVYPPPHGNDRNDIFGLDVTGDPSHPFRLNSDFLLYSGLEDGHPKRVPLRVRLFCEEGAKIPESPAFSYLNACRGILNSSFSDAAEDDSEGVVRFECPETYANYRSYVDSFDETRTPYTEVQQVDQFWANSNDTGFADLRPYLYLPTMRLGNDNGVSRWRADERNDPYGEFQLFSPLQKNVPADQSPATICRASFLIDPWLGVTASTSPAVPVDSGSEKATADNVIESLNAGQREDVDIETTTDAEPNSGQKQQSQGRVTRVPLHADFGFILADRNLWFNARFQTLVEEEFVDAADERSALNPADDVDDHNDDGVGVHYSWIGDYNSIQTIGEVWNALCPEGEEFRDLLHPNAPIEKKTVSWPLFFDACLIVAEFSDAPAFDLDTETEENLTCLILEVWLSSIENFLVFFKSENGGGSSLPSWLERLQTFLSLVGEEEMAGGASNSSPTGLNDLVKDAAPFLIFTLDSILRVMKRTKFQATRKIPSKANPEAAAIRTWYSTAERLQEANPKLVPLRLPGTRICRGDWYLAVRVGSRSSVLAYRTIDKLLSHELSAARLIAGTGLPRRALSQEAVSFDRTATNSGPPTATSQNACLTALRTISANGLPRRKYSLQEILQLGTPKDSNRHWIWRHQIGRYSRNASWFRSCVSEYLDDALSNYELNTLLFDATDIDECLEEWSESPQFHEEGDARTEGFWAVWEDYVLQMGSTLTARQMREKKRRSFCRRFNVFLSMCGENWRFQE